MPRLRPGRPSSGLLAALLAVSFWGCSSSSSRGVSETRAPTGGDQSRAHGPIRVVTVIYPLSFLVSQVGGRNVSVTNLAGGAGEPHDLELTSGKVRSLAEADLVVYLSGDFQPAVEQAVEQVKDKSVDALSVIGKTERPGDPHLWLDPTLMTRVARVVAERLALLDKPRSASYLERADHLADRLSDLDSRFASGLKNCKRRDFVAAHRAFGFLARRYGLNEIGIAGFSAESEPTPQRMAQAARFARAHGVTTVFFERRISSELAAVLAEEAGLQTDLLDPLEAPPGKGDYFTVMSRNLVSLRRALECA